MDYDRMRLEEMAAISDFLHESNPAEWDHPSLCDGWRVRDVISHNVTGPAEAILLAASGRAVALNELSGEGLDTLRARLAG